MPAIMPLIRDEIRRQPRCGLTVPQFRAMIFAELHPGEPLSELAEFTGLSLSAASRMVDLLVRRGLVRRRPDAADRRRVSLGLTARGRAVFRQSDRALRAALGDVFSVLPEKDLKLIARALGLILETFQRPAPAATRHREVTP